MLFKQFTILNLQLPTFDNNQQSFRIKLQHFCHRVVANFILLLSVTGHISRVDKWLWCDVGHYCGEEKEERRLTGETLLMGCGGRWRK